MRLSGLRPAEDVHALGGDALLQPSVVIDIAGLRGIVGQVQPPHGNLIRHFGDHAAVVAHALVRYAALQIPC